MTHTQAGSTGHTHTTSGQRPSIAATTPARTAMIAFVLLAVLVGAVQGQTWEGWATQTQFGCGENAWPYEPGRGKTTLILTDIQPLVNGGCAGNNPYSTFGAAMPWRYVCKRYGSRDAYVQAVYDAWYGSSKAPVCFEVQPINRVPANIAEGSYDMPSLATNPQPASINSDGIVAKQANGSPYPKFQLVPYEGCGGNCVWQSGTGGQGSTEDCFNSCYGVGNEEQQQDAIQCDFAWAAGNPTCAGMYSLWGGGAWPDSGNNFADYSAAYAINVDATFPAPLQSCEKPTNVKGNWYKPSSTPTCQFANWCSGISMHMDWTFSGAAPWNISNYAPYPKPEDPDNAGPATQFGGDPAYEQIMFRYRSIPCRNWHDTLGVNPPHPSFQQCALNCNGDRRCVKRCRSACNANCKRYAKELEQQNCTVLGGTARSRCEYRVKAFKYGCLSICALPSA